jgi:hypothetical protein
LAQAVLLNHRVQVLEMLEALLPLVLCCPLLEVTQVNMAVVRRRVALEQPLVICGADLLLLAAQVVLVMAAAVLALQRVAGHPAHLMAQAAQAAFQQQPQLAHKLAAVVGVVELVVLT